MIDYICTDDDLYEGRLTPETCGSVGIDLRAAATVVLKRGEVKMVSSGVRLDMTSHPRLFAMLVPRSSTGIKGVALANTVGVIDNDYQGEVGMPLLYRGEQDVFTVERGTRVAQLVFLYSALPPKTFLHRVKAFFSETLRGGGGFGSTGER